MNDRVKASLLWGVIGMLSFLVLLQGYEFATDHQYDLTVTVGAALVVAVGAPVLTYLADGVLS